MQKINVFWFRRDLRLEDNAGLYHALKAGFPVLPVFIFDENILEKLPEKKDARIEFLHHTLNDLQEELTARERTIHVVYGRPLEVWSELTSTYHINAVFTNRDYESYALKRDAAVRQLLAEKGISFHTFKDHVIFEKGEVLKKDGTPYTVFTPYSRRWKEKVNSEDGVYLRAYPTEKYYPNFLKESRKPIPDLAEIGFEPSGLTIPGKTVARGLIKNYDKTRNFPALSGTSRLGVHFRFGTISIREKVRKARNLNETFLNELIWRDFYSMILANFPHVENHPFRKKYENIPWRNNEKEFQLWCAGQTGYPIVDAGMRELNQTGYMHNRVRMITASFLTKHLLIDWRWGAAYFAEKLLDYDLASNNGGWQWAAGCGTDAAPYFRIFNPTTQMKKFDQSLEYVKKWVPELGTPGYPAPMVDHKMARDRCLQVYKTALN